MFESSFLLELQHKFAFILRSHRLQHVVIITPIPKNNQLLSFLYSDIYYVFQKLNAFRGGCLPWAVFITLVEFGHVFAEDLLAFFAGHDDFRRLHDFMVLGLRVALGTIEP